MSLIDLSCLCLFLVFAHLSESRVLILRDYEYEPFVLDHGGRSIKEVAEPNQEAFNINSHYRPKKMQSLKKTILQYGRHIYHLDDFEDLKESKSKITELKTPVLKDSPVSYDYADINDWRSVYSANDGDLLLLSGKPLHFCNGEDCEEERKTFRKYDDHKDWKHKKNRLKFIKRFQVVENRHQSAKEPKRTKYDSSEKYHKKKKTSKKKKKNKKIQNDSSESVDSEKRSSESSESDKKYRSEESRELKKKTKKKYVSYEDWTDESNTIENIPKIKKKNKKKNYESSDETERKTMTVEEDYFMQGNKIFHSNNRKKKNRHDGDRRRRLEHFLPKRYHWEPEEIHELGYFWFNGPKGAYPAPKPL